MAPLPDTFPGDMPVRKMLSKTASPNSDQRHIARNSLPRLIGMISAVFICTRPPSYVASASNPTREVAELGPSSSAVVHFPCKTC